MDALAHGKQCLRPAHTASARLGIGQRCMECGRWLITGRRTACQKGRSGRHYFLIDDNGAGS